MDETVNNVLEYKVYNVYGEDDRPNSRREFGSSPVAMPIDGQLPKAQASSQPLHHVNEGVWWCTWFRREGNHWNVKADKVVSEADGKYIRSVIIIGVIMGRRRGPMTTS